MKVPRHAASRRIKPRNLTAAPPSGALAQSACGSVDDLFDSGGSASGAPADDGSPASGEASRPHPSSLPPSRRWWSSRSRTAQPLLPRQRARNRARRARLCHHSRRAPAPISRAPGLRRRRLRRRSRAPVPPAGSLPRRTHPGAYNAHRRTISLLLVRAPVGARVRVRCGGSCPIRRLARATTARALRVRSFERHLRTGTLVEVSVTRPGSIGKYTRFRIRWRGAPARTDLVPVPGRRAPRACQ